MLTQVSGGVAGSIFYGTGAAGNAAPTWTNRGVPQICDQGTLTEYTRGQAWYDLIGGVDPNDANTLYIGGIDVLKTTDAGATFSQVSVWSTYTNGISSGSPSWANCGFSASPRPYMHADQHAILFVGGSSSTMIFGNDGGVYYGTNMNTTPAIITKSPNLNITQYYACAVNPNSESNEFLAGAQDNGTQRFAQIGLGSTSNVSGGDGAFCHIDQDNPAIQISAYTNQSYYVTTDGWTTSNNRSTTGGSFINPTDYDSTNDLLYACNTAGTFSRMTTAGVFTNVTVTAFGTSTVTHVMVSPNTPTTVYFGLNNGNVVRVDNAHTASGTVAGVTVRTGSASTSVSCLAIETGNEAHQLVTYSNYGVTQVLETTNGTAATPTWTSIDGNLPDMPVRWAIFAPNNNDHALLATELGVWMTDDINGGSTVWTTSSTISLANTRIDMLQTRSSDDLIVAASHGRGLFSTCKYCPYNRLSYSTTATSVAESAMVTGSTCQKYTDITIPVTIDKAPSANVTVTVTASGTATSEDYLLLTPTITFTPTGKLEQLVNVRLYNDDVDDANSETVILTIATASAEITSTINTVHTITITDDDNAPAIASIFTATIGSGAINSNNATPFRGSYEDGRIQYIYTAAELTAAGFTAGNISELALNVIKNSSGSFQNFTISMANTAQTISNPFVTTGLTTVYTSNYATTNGTNRFIFSTPFTWNGTSNIAVHFCFDNPNGTTAGDIDYVMSHSNANTDYFHRLNGTTGCTLAGNFVNNSRANMTFVQSNAAGVQTAVNPSAGENYLGPNQTVHFFDDSGNIMATIQNNSAHDFGCTKVEIDRAGTGTAQFWNTAPSSFIAQKSFKITPTNNNASASHTTTLYYTAAEISGWMSATGKALTDFQLIKIANAQISAVTPATPYATDVSIGTTTRSDYKGTDHAFTSNFLGFSGFGGGNPGPLPVSLTSFSGEIVGKTVELDWTTSTELNNDYFDLERSADGKSFNKITRIKGAGTTTTPQKYDYTDINPLAGVSYYRLSQTDFDGKTTKHNTISVRFDAIKPLEITPNPISSQLNLTLNNFTPNEPIMITVFDAAGKLIYQERVNINTTNYTIEANHWANGNYMLRVQQAEKSYTLPFIKQ